MEEESKLFKDVFFKETFIDEFSQALSFVLPDFNKKTFKRKVFDKQWQDKELKHRVSHIVDVLKTTLPSSYPDAVSIILKVVEHLKQQQIKEVSFGYVCLPEYVERYGLDDYKLSVKALEQITEFITCEFAVRPFIIQYEEKMIEQMQKWSKHKKPKVRRLASEGCRPRLPWAIALPEYKRAPAPILPILENLKADKDIWVQKSVANNLNDISKDNPEIAKSIFRNWLGDNKTTNWIVKHAARTLLKKGDQEVLKLFGLGKDETIKLTEFHVDTPKVKVGGHLQFSFALHNTSKQEKLIRVEYSIYYLRANGTWSKKVFKISEKSYAPRSTNSISRKQSFRPITTRIYYPGIQKVSVILNGHESSTIDFELT